MFTMCRKIVDVQTTQAQSFFGSEKPWVENEIGKGYKIAFKFYLRSGVWLLTVPLHAIGEK